MTRVVFVGDMYNADLSVGGGPIYPGAPQPPLGIWGPTDPRPTHPIAGYPWQPPLGIWGPTDPRPTHPIAGYPWPTQPPYPDHALPPFATNLPVVPPQQPIIDPIDPSKAYVVAYTPKSGGGYERTTFTVQIPPPTTPTEPEPKPVG